MTPEERKAIAMRERPTDGVSSCDSPRISSESWGGGDIREVACGECESCRAP